MATLLIAGVLVPAGTVTAEQGQVPDWAPTSVSAGFDSVCARLADGTVWCWGNNDRGQLGIGETSTEERLPVQVEGLDPAAGVSVGRESACAWLADGTVWCWGSGEGGRLGNGTSEDSSSPVLVDGIDTAVGVSVGRTHACAWLADGTVWCWGTESKGELGDGGAAASTAESPVQVDTTSSAASVSAGDTETCLITSTGTVQCWGAGDKGQLGNGGSTDAATPVAVTGLTGATAVSVGGGRACATLTAGGSTCWGLNDFGQLGVGDTTNRSVPTSVVSLPTGTVGSVGSGAAVSCWVPSDGSVRCAGAGWSGLTVVGGSTSPHTMIGQGAVAVTVGEFVVCALLADHSVWCFGNEESVRGRPGEWLTWPGRVWLPAPPFGISVSVSGDLVVDGTAYVYAEFEDIEFEATAWQWQESADGETNWTDIDDAAEDYLNLVDLEVGTYIRVVVTYSNDLGEVEVVSPGAAIIDPLDIGTPLITGAAGVGKELTVTTPDLVGPQPISFEYYWLVYDDDVEEYIYLEDLEDPIEYDWESATFTVPEQLAGKSVKVEVYAYNDSSDDWEEAEPVQIAPMPKLRSVSIDGTPTVGNTLTASPKGVVGTARYKWQSSANRSSWRDEDGSGSSFAVTRDVAGRWVRVVCTVSNASGSISKTADAVQVPMPALAKPTLNRGSTTSSSATFTFSAESGLTYTATARVDDKTVPKKDVTVEVKKGNGTVTVTGLAPVQSVSVVLTVSDGQRSRDSDAVSAITKAAPPSPARSVRLSVSSTKTPTVSWTAPTSTGGATVKYAVDVLDTQGRSVASASGLTTTTWSGTKALAKGSYTASVVASNSAGAARAAESSKVTVR